MFENAFKRQEQFPKTDNHLRVTIARPLKEAYAFFRDFDHLPDYVEELKSVKVESKQKSQWKVEFNGIEFESVTEIIEEKPEQMFSWKNTGSAAEIWGDIHFKPVGKNQTEIEINFDYKILGGKFTEMLMQLSGDDPREVVEKRINQLKEILEEKVSLKH